MAELPPFSCSFTPGIPKLLFDLKCTIAITTYQAGKVIFISARNPEQLVQLPRSFKKPMGIALHQNRMAIATRHEVVVLQNVPAVAQNYPKQPQTYDALYMPRAAYFTSELDIHDLHFTDKGLLAVNTRFSCLSIINEQQSFLPVWKPSFIQVLEPNDQCHLNGLAFANGKPKYVTALGKTDTGGGWRSGKASGGILMDVDTNEIILSGLPMPHSPRQFGKNLYALLSATGEFVLIDTAKGRYQVVQRLDGFVRGMDIFGDFVFIGLSKLRTTSKAFGDLPIATRSLFSGICVIHLPTGKIAGQIKYEASVEEIFDVRVLPGIRRPNALNHYKDEHHQLITTPTGNYWAQTKDEESESTMEEDNSSKTTTE